ncbi:MAG: hypothetical protein ABI868_21330 [Acidobacteriota bacterium]
MALQTPPTAIRLSAGALLGAGIWPLLSAAFPFVPPPVRFLIAWLLFTFGPGIGLAGALTRELDPLRRLIVVLGVGSAATPVLIDVLGRLHLVPAFPYLAAALAGGGLAWWTGRTAGRTASTPRVDIAWSAALVVLAVGLGAIVFWHRLDVSSGGVILYGDYDTADLGYYAAEASEAAHTVPPTASYYSGHRLNAAYYPHLVLGMIHRFAAVPVLPIYYRYAWPTFLGLTALTSFALVRSLSTPGVAALSVVLLLVGGDFSYLAARYLPHANFNWDYVLWPTNFLSPTMEVQHFSTWGPSLPLFFVTLYALVRGLQTRQWGWIVLGSFVLGVLFEFKPFAFIVLMAALCAAAVFAGADWPARRRYAATVALGVLFSLPFVIGAISIDPSDRRSRLVFDVLLLPKRMLIKIDLTTAFADAARRLSPWPVLETPVFLLLATVVFLAVGIGVRWVGAPGVWRAIRGRGPAGPDAAGWRLLGWGVVAGIAIPCVVATEPYVDTLQFHLTGLYLLWIFAAAGLVAFARAHRRTGAIAVAAAIAVAVPSSIHFLSRKWTDAERPPRVTLTRNENAIAEHLRRYDPETTVILHDRPLAPSLTTIVAGRRIVLGWDVRYSAVGGEERLADVNAFFGSSRGDPEAAFDVLRRYHVTHLIVRSEDSVHPAVLARLKPLVTFPDVTLYAVPPTIGP